MRTESVLNHLRCKDWRPNSPKKSSEKILKKLPSTEASARTGLDNHELSPRFESHQLLEKSAPSNKVKHSNFAEKQSPFMQGIYKVYNKTSQSFKSSKSNPPSKPKFLLSPSKEPEPSPTVMRVGSMRDFEKQIGGREVSEHSKPSIKCLLLSNFDTPISETQTCLKPANKKKNITLEEVSEKTSALKSYPSKASPMSTKFSEFVGRGESYKSSRGALGTNKYFSSKQTIQRNSSQPKKKTLTPKKIAEPSPQPTLRQDAKPYSRYISNKSFKGDSNGKGQATEAIITITKELVKQNSYLDQLIDSESPFSLRKSSFTMGKNKTLSKSKSGIDFQTEKDGRKSQKGLTMVLDTYQALQDHKNLQEPNQQHSEENKISPSRVKHISLCKHDKTYKYSAHQLILGNSSRRQKK